MSNGPKFQPHSRQVAHKSYTPCVVRATDIAMGPTGQVTKNVANPAKNEPVIGREDTCRLLLTRWGGGQVLNFLIKRDILHRKVSSKPKKTS